MNASRPLAVSIALALAAHGFAQKPEGDLAKILPADTLLYAAVTDVSAVLSIDAEGAVRKLLDHPAAKRALEGIREEFDWLEDQEVMTTLDLEPKEIVRMLNGRLVVALPSLTLEKRTIEASGSQARVDLEVEPTRGLALLVDLDVTPDRFEELLGNIEKFWKERENVNKVTLVSEEYEGVRIWQFEVEETSGAVSEDSARFAFVDGLLLASDKKETIEDLVDRVKNGAPEGDRLSEQASYRETVERTGKSDLLVHVDVEELMPMVNTLIEHELTEAGDAAIEYVTGPNLVASLGLDAFSSFFVSVDVESDEVAATVGYTQESRERGLAELMAYTDRGVEIPTYFHSGLHSASVSTFDFTRLYRLVMDMIQKASPYAHRVVRTQIEKVEKYGFPLESALLENTDGFLAEILGYPEGFTPGPDDHPSQAYILRIKDGKTLREAVAEYAEMNLDDDPVEYMNEFIYKMEMPIPMPGVGSGSGSPELAIAIVGNYAIAGIGDARMVESVIGHLKNPGEKLTDDQRLMSAFDELPDEDVVAIGWIDVASVLTNFLRTFRDFARFSVDSGDSDEFTREFAGKEMSDLPDVSDLDYFIVTKTYRTPETFVQRMLLRRGAK